MDDLGDTFLRTLTEAELDMLEAELRRLVMGGVNDDNAATPVAELYNPLAGMFELTGSMVSPRSFFPGTLLLDGRVWQ